MMRAQDKRTWAIGGAVAAAALVAAGWFFVVEPVESNTSSLRAQTTSTQGQNLLIQSKVASLAAQHHNVARLAQELGQTLAQLPLDNGLPAFTRQLSRQAKANGVTLDSVNVGGFASVTASGGGNLVSIAVTVNSTGPATQQLAFLHAVQVSGPRRALVTSTALATASDKAGGSIDAACKMTTALTVFSAPRTATERAQLEKLLRAR